MSQQLSESRRAFADHVSHALATRSSQIVEAWLARLDRRQGVRPASDFPRELLRRRMPAIIADVAEALRGGPCGEDLVERLRRLTRERFRLGHDVQELLEETELLGRLCFDALSDAVSTYPDGVDATVASTVAGRLHGIFGRAMTITTGTYRGMQYERRRDHERRLHDFGRALVHELKNPIGAAIGAAELLEEEGIGGVPEQRRHFAAIIVRNLDRARELVDDVRSLARVGRGADTLRLEPERLDRVIRRVIEDCRATSETDLVRIDVESPLPEVRVDRRRVELVLSNLVGNAVKYADPAKPDRRITIRANRDDGGTRVEVQDNGVGVAAAARERIFERFYRADDDEAPGSGLGLAIAREAVEQMGGEIGFHSEPGAGSTFFFTVMPADEVEQV